MGGHGCGYQCGDDSGCGWMGVEVKGSKGMIVGVGEDRYG